MGLCDVRIWQVKKTLQTEYSCLKYIYKVGVAASIHS